MIKIKSSQQVLKIMIQVLKIELSKHNKDPTHSLGFGFGSHDLIVGLAVVLNERKTGWSDLVCIVVSGRGKRISLVEIGAADCETLSLDVISGRLLRRAGSAWLLTLATMVCFREREWGYRVECSCSRDDDVRLRQKVVLSIDGLSKSAGLMSKKLPPARRVQRSLDH
ncbi:hypothetical protein Tco_1005338 [Tanacetum coccineum]|uniref:Uncharacterized protein n=1 Tax=Tanacetum coccineum TaxID=301880 RepID=A0ABQ5FEQ8_9ASTR